VTPAFRKFCGNPGFSHDLRLIARNADPVFLYSSIGCRDFKKKMTLLACFITASKMDVNVQNQDIAWNFTTTMVWNDFFQAK